jgi:hypothetical protein
MKLYPLGGKVSGATFTRRITGALRRDGWRVYPQKFMTVAPPRRVYSYGFNQGGAGGLLYVVAGQRDLARWARFEFQSQCFKLPVQALPTQLDRVPLPHPSSRS